MHKYYGYMIKKVKIKETAKGCNGVNETLSLVYRMKTMVHDQNEQ